MSELQKSEESSLFDRVVSILEQARGNVVRSINSNMVLAYWLVGREIILELQGGEDRAKYGEKLLETLSKKLTKRYGQGFSEQSLQNFRRFYQAFSDRVEISSPAGRKSLSLTNEALLSSSHLRMQEILGIDVGHGFIPCRKRSPALRFKWG